MKWKVAATLMAAVFVLSGCQNKVQEDKRMDDTKATGLKLEYDAYASSIVDSGYNWYSRYVNQFVSSLASNGYNVDRSMVEDEINSVKIKKKQIENMDPERISKGIDESIKELMKKDKKNAVYEKELKMKKEKIRPNKEHMIEILDKIEQGLSLGLDGNYSQEDLAKISKIQTDIIKIYDEDIRNHKNM